MVINGKSSQAKESLLITEEVMSYRPVTTVNTNRIIVK
jgi:hypothetical protein